MRIGFLYNAQNHHLLHSLPIACELSRRRDTHVAVLTRDEHQLSLARRLAGLYPQHRVTFEPLHSPPLARFWRRPSPLSKNLMLFINRSRLDAFDALVVPERTSVRLRRFGVSRPKLIHTFHGPSGHDRAEDPRLSRFDLLLASSPRRLERIRRSQGVVPERSAVIGYCKFDLVSRLHRRPDRLGFDARPIVLYNPHHWLDKSSWPLMGRQILRRFRDRGDFNLIFAPHVRLFDPAARHAHEFDEFRSNSSLRIDLGSDHSIDMTYSMAADIYLGDVSSQAFEFAMQPRPCIFLNPRGLEWRDREDFASWNLGPVVTNLPELDLALASVDRWRHQFDGVQSRRNLENFPDLGAPPPVLGARAIVAFMQDRELRPGWQEVFAS